MSWSHRVFRVFVSSTFSDLKWERDVLQQRTFPNLRRYCQERGARFQAIDLRWGVSEEAAVDQQTMTICLEELRRCQELSPRPNFIVLLGDRYGSRPLPSPIEACEFEALQAQLSAAERERLQLWYRRDDNAVPPVYLLQPRSGEWTETRRWAAEEIALRAIVVGAAERALAGDDPRRHKYSDSATHQEIRHGALTPADAASHVFCYLREFSSVPDPAAPEAGKFLDLALSPSTAGQLILDREAQQRLRMVKQQLSAKLAPTGHIYRYTISGHEALLGDECDSATEKVLHNLAARVEGDLKRIIDEQLTRPHTEEQVDPEAEAHRQFGARQRQHFGGRDDLLDRIRAYLADDSRRPLVVHGPSGCGKTALLAEAVRLWTSARPEQPVVERCIGAAPGSSDLHTLLEGVCLEAARAAGSPEGALPYDARGLADEFSRRLQEIGARQPIVIFLDGLDQLDPGGEVRNLLWFPSSLPPGVKLVVSAVVDDGPMGECCKAMERIVGEEGLLAVGAFGIGSAAALLTAWLTAVSRRLQPKQRQQVLSKFAVDGLPLYLKLAFEEASRWTSYQEDCWLQAGVDGVAGAWLGRLVAARFHGPTLVGRCLGLLTAARYGLSEEELIDLLSQDRDVRQEFLRRHPHSPQSDALPVVIWVRLFADLRPYLGFRGTGQGNLLGLFHRQLEVVVRRHLVNDTAWLTATGCWVTTSSDSRSTSTRRSSPRTSASWRSYPSSSCGADSTVTCRRH